MRKLVFLTIVVAAGFATAGYALNPGKPCNPHRCPPTTTTTTPGPTYVFDDEFNGAALDTTKWWATPWCSSSGDDAEQCYNAANAYVSGGSLHLRNSLGTMGRPYDSARVQTFREGGWPPPQVLASVRAPVHVEARIMFGGASGSWGGFWANGVNSTGYVELDMQEYRDGYPTQDHCAIHSWGTIAGQYNLSSLVDTGQDLSAGWHVYWVDYYADHAVFGIDGATCGQGATPNQPIGIRLSNVIGVPGTWGGSNGPPAASELPSEMLVDYVRAWAL